MARAYPGYVYQPYPKMVQGNFPPLGYKIVNSEEELNELFNKKRVEGVVKEDHATSEIPAVSKKKPGPKPKLMFTEA